MLSLVATPIGNLKDITRRAIETLESSDYILCEDTRTSQVLLNHYQIKRPLRSLHKFNEASSLEKIANDVREGKNVALISDAGTPGISDPGERLVSHFIEQGLPYTLIPGPSAPIMALALSGFQTHPFQFVGFMPKDKRKSFLEKALAYEGTTLLFETPHQIGNFLELLNEIAPERNLAICRELTKKFESVVRGTASELMKGQYRGEIVVVIEGAKAEIDTESLLVKIKELHEKGLSKKDAIEFVTRGLNLKKRDLYKNILPPL